MIAGGTGFIGDPLVRRLLQRDAQVSVISRSPAKVRVGRGISWDAVDEIGAADVVINLAGENIGARWTEARKQRILDSRIRATSALVAAMQKQPARPRTFISASAVGYYGARGDETLDETAPPGNGFLTIVTRRWEEQAQVAERVARVVIARFGVVLAADGGALGKMLLPFRAGVGGRIGDGRQWMSWIDRDDIIGFVEWAIDRDAARGVYNLTAPEPVTNRDFTRTLGRVLRRPTILPVPPFALRLLFGEMADETLLTGQRVVPARATREGFVFRYPTLDASLRHALSR